MYAYWKGIQLACNMKKRLNKKESVVKHQYVLTPETSLLSSNEVICIPTCQFFFNRSFFSPRALLKLFPVASPRTAITFSS